MPVLSMAYQDLNGAIMTNNVDQPQDQNPSESAANSPQAQSPDEESSSSPNRRSSSGVWPLIAAAALGVCGWQWYETRARLTQMEQNLTMRLAESDAASKESKTIAKESMSSMAKLQSSFGELAGKVDETDRQQKELAGLYEGLMRNEERLALADIEQSLSFADQQLQLASNVPAAISAVESAEKRLSNNSQPQFVTLRKALASDLDRLRALPHVDTPGLYLHLENVISAIDKFPLAVSAHVPEKATAVQAASHESPSPFTFEFWTQWASSAWADIKGVVRIQRFDRQALGLVAPEQVFYLREHIKLRLLNARMALLSRDDVTYRGELRQASDLINRYFDSSSQSVLVAQEALRQLLSSEIFISIPSLGGSLSAVRNLKELREVKP